MMDISSTSLAENLFAATLTRSNGLDSLASAALQRGIDLYLSKDYEGAAKEFKRSAGLGRFSGFGVESYHYLAMSYLQLQEPESAIKAYQDAIQLDPTRDDSHANLGNLYFAQNRYDDARSEYAEALKINPTNANRYSLGQSYIELGRYEDAAAQFNEIVRTSPQEAGGYLGMGLAYGRQKRYEDAIQQFNQAVDKNPNLADGYLEMGYAYADMGDMDSAQNMIKQLEGMDQPDLADTLSRYMYKVDPPKMVFAKSSSTFPFSLGIGTPLVALNTYLMNANASKTLTIQIQFDKQMDRESIENIFNWEVGRAIGQGPGQAYNYGLAIRSTEIKLQPIPDAVTWDADMLTATVYFTVTQNASANGTIDPSHIEFKFSGQDIYGLKMNPKFDQFTGFSGVF